MVRCCRDICRADAVDHHCERLIDPTVREPNRLWVMFRAIFTGLVTPWEIWRIIGGNNVSLEAMNQELLTLDLNRSVRSVEVPVVFFLGKYDHHVDARIAAAYVVSLCAPVKRVVWFEKSAHNVPFEEATCSTPLS